MQIATTETHRILLHENTLFIEHCASHATVGEAEAGRVGLLSLLENLVTLEAVPQTPDERALTFTTAALDAEAQLREERDGLLQSLCAQIELFLGRTPFPEKQT